nr:2-phospho-L-lactate guanylyltransferase [Amycolatopsis alkalitolerans]
MPVDLIVPMKPPRLGKSRLRGAVDDARHAELVLALASDTIAAASEVVRRVLVVAADPRAVRELAGFGAEIVGEDGPGDLNAALRQGEAHLRADDPGAILGALQADLPALRPEDLEAALAASAGRRAFVADWERTGTTLLLSAPGAALAPRFGPGSARAHARTGAIALGLTAPSLRRDVDTAADLEHAGTLGLGKRTAALVYEGSAA